jgi:hypothetical protein
MRSAAKIIPALYVLSKQTRWYVFAITLSQILYLN